MAWDNVKSALVGAITQHADYSCANVLVEHSRVLGSGVARAVVINNGGVAREDWTWGTEKLTWTIWVDVYSRWTGQIQAVTANTSSDSQKVLDTISQYPRLNGSTGILNAAVQSIVPVDPINEGRTAYTRQRVSVIVQEIVTPNRQE